MSSIWQDVRVAVRLYLRAPMFTVTVLVILALAIGVNSAIFSVVNAVLLRPLPYPRASELVAVVQVATETGASRPISPPNYFDLREQIAIVFRNRRLLEPERQHLGRRHRAREGARRDLLDPICSACSASRPRQGAASSPTTTVPGAPRVAILGHGLWQRRFGGDAGAVGRELMLDGAPTLIVGVMPRGFEFPTAGTELWVPLRLSRSQPPNPAIRAEAYRQYRILRVVARLDGGATRRARARRARRRRWTAGA